MGPKKALSADEADEIKKSLDFLTEEVPAVRLPQEKKTNILDLVKEVKALRTENAEKDKQIAYL